jgi:hypothetical protein
VSLQHSNWRYVGVQTFSVSSIAVVMDALHTLGTSSTYADSTSRTAGSGSAGTWTKVQIGGTTEAVYVTPATAPLNHRITFAGTSYTPSPSPTMQTPDTYAANTLMVNLTKNAGSFATWNAAAPFTSGQTFGYWRLWPNTAGVGSVYLWESRDSVAVLISTAAGAVYGCIAGAIIDPESGDTTTDAESDGGVYGIITSGASVISTTFWTAPSSGFSGFLGHSASNGAAHAGVFSPGSGSVLTVNPALSFGLSPSATGLKTRSGQFARLAVIMRATSPDNYIGRLREIYAYSDAQSPAKQSNGATTIGYVFGSSTANFADSILLEH